MKYQLSIPYSIDRESLLNRWQWFRKCLMDFYGLTILPEAFTKNEGEISENKRIDETDPGYDMAAPEYNYNWRRQTLVFTEGLFIVTVTINEDDLYDYYFFKLEIKDEPKSEVKFFSSAKERYFEFDVEFSKTAKWHEAIGGLSA